MKIIYFLVIISFVFCFSAFAENEAPYARDEEILQPDELPPEPAVSEPKEKPVLSGNKAKAMDRAAKKAAEKKAKIDEKKAAANARKQAALEKKQAKIDERKAAAEAAKQAKIEEAEKKAAEKKAIEQAKEETKREEEKLKAAEVENKRIEKEIAQEKALEEARAKKAERAKLEQELEQKRLTDVERRERLYKKIEDIEEERNIEHLKKHGTAVKEEAPKSALSDKKIPEDVAELMKKGDDLYNSGNYDGAREHYDKARFLLDEKNKSSKK